MTRARCQVVTWWVPATTCAASPVHRLLIGRPEPGDVPAEVYRIPADAAALDALRGLASEVLAVEDVQPGTAAATVTVPRAGPVAAELTAARFERALDREWRRTSYSALTAGAGHASSGVGSEPEAPGTDDEAPIELATQSSAGVPAAVPSPMAELPVGTGFGTLVHAIFEAADLTAAQLPAELTARAAEELARNPVPGLEASTLGRGARAVGAHPARPAGRRAARWPTSARATGSRSSTSSCRSPVARAPVPGSCSAIWRRCCAATSRRRIRCTPTRRRSPRRRSRSSRCAAT